jgi:hypothetical protein
VPGTVGEKLGWGSCLSEGALLVGFFGRERLGEESPPGERPLGEVIVGFLLPCRAQ